MTDNNKKMELLAPVGGKAQLIAAVENGADAVYLGGNIFNARIGAENFSLEEMEKGVDYAHVRGVKVYVTLNTLMTDRRLKEALKYVESLYAIGVDALIVQDIGLGKAIKERFPDFPLHLSTQATVYNPEGVEAAAKLGYERVVLARELSEEEIKACCKTATEIEVFVHGAICLCYSGQCHLSRNIGGRSGNRGVCAQPCRLLYKEDGKQENTYALSPKDLSLIDYLDRLWEAGVTSLKIEGRMKSPEYVATVVRIYRKYIDQLMETGSYRVSEEDREAITQIFNRGGFTSAYFDGDPGKAFMSGELSKNHGIQIGEVVSIGKRGLVEIKLTGKLKQGDIVEARGGSRMTSTKVTYMEEVGGKGKGKRLVIGDFKENPEIGDKLYRMVSQELVKQAESTFRETDYNQGKFLRRATVDMKLEAYVGRDLKLTLKDVEAELGYTLEGEPTAEALNRKTSHEEIAQQLRKTGQTPFSVGKVEIVTGGDVFLPLSVVNRLRRLALADFEEKKKKGYKRQLSIQSQSLDKDQGAKFQEIKAEEKDFEIRCDTIEEYEKALGEKLAEKLTAMGIPREKMIWVLPAYELLKRGIPETDMRIIPYIENLTKGPMDKWIRENVKAVAALAKAGAGKLYIGNIGQAQMFSGENLHLLADFGMNVLNRETERAYETLGIKGGVYSLEALDWKAGSYPLMVTEHLMEAGTLTDRKGVRYKVTADDFSHKTTIKNQGRNLDLNQAAQLWREGERTLRIYL